MRKIAWIFAVLLAAATTAGAQDYGSAPKWDVSVTAGLFEARPRPPGEEYQDDWYYQGRYAIAIGRYWTEHLKSEIEFATTGEGSRLAHEFARMPGTGYVYPYSFEKFHRVQQGTARLVYQFRENAWVHPYLSAGFLYEVDRQRSHMPAQYNYMDPRADPRVPVRPEFSSDTTYEHRAGVSVGGGTKIYMSQSAFFNTGMLVTYAHPATTVTFLAGFGMDF